LAPPAGSQPPPRWARGPLSVPCKLGTPAYRLNSKIRSKTYCHMPYSSRSCLLARGRGGGSIAVTYPTASDPASLLGRALALSRVLQLRISPPCSGGLRHCHVSRGTGSRLPAREGSDAATCPAASYPTSLLGRAPVLPRVPRLRTLPPYSRGLQCCHMHRGSGPRLPVREGSGVATCPVALSRPRTSGINKCLAGLGMQVGLRVSNAHSCVTKAPARRAGRLHHYDPQDV
jgi:hypothetical protein